MMGKTHITIGMASALALTAVNTPAGIAVALAGGALGGVMPDVDTLRNDYKHDAMFGELLAVSVVASAAVMDYFLKWGICADVLANQQSAILGAVLMLALWIFGLTREHRTFTHSILSMALFSLAAAFIYVPFGVSFMIGYLSHLLLDILNKKGILLLYPMKNEICLNLCYAGKLANTIFMIFGYIATISLTIFRVLTLHGVI